jgi:hypothetical protein
VSGTVRGWGVGHGATWTGEEPARTGGAVERRGAGARGAAWQGGEGSAREALLGRAEA